MTQPETMALPENGYDTLEVIEICEHITLLQISEDGESETLVIGPGQQEALLKLLLERQGK